MNWRTANRRARRRKWRVIEAWHFLITYRMTLDQAEGHSGGTGE